MKVLEFGNYFKNKVHFDYISKRTLLEYDMVLIDSSYIGFKSEQHYDMSYLKRREQLEEFILFKNIPIVFFTPIPENIRIISNRSIIDKEFNFFVPSPKLQTEHQEGTEMIILPSTPFSDLMNKYEQYFRYKLIFRNKPGNTIVETPHTKFSLGFWDRNCVFLPTPESAIRAVEDEFFEDLFTSISEIRKTPGVAQLPDWARSYFIFNEKTITDQINSTQSEIERLNNLKQQKKKEFEEIERFKLLFTSSGPELELIVEEILSKIGFEILNSEQNRQDLILKYNEKIAIVEIKGVNGSAAEKHAAQLEKWTASYLEKTGEAPKPILIVNAFKDLPLEQRIDKPFPHQMLKYSEIRGHCLITTVQLFGLYAQIASTPETSSSLIETLFETSGVYANFQNWQDFIDREDFPGV